jgi:cysteine-rich repeat protein
MAMKLSRLAPALLCVACSPEGQSESTGEDTGSSETTSPTTTTSTTSVDESGPAGECGNGMVEAPEACDDGNEVEADGCSTTCRVSGTVEWERTLESGAGYGVAAAPDGQAIVVGNDLANDILLAAWMLDGELAYPASIDGTGMLARGLGVVVGEQGAIFAVGIDGSDGDFDGFVRRITAPETVEWVTPIGTAGVDDQAQDVAFDPDGNLVVVGYGDSGAATGIDAWIVRVDIGGSVIETLPIAQDGDDFAYGLDVSSTGEIAVAGSVPGMVRGTDMALWRLAADGTVMWMQTEDGDALDRGSDAAFDAATGDILVVGTVNSNIWLRRYQPDGNDAFTKTVDSGMDSAGNTDEGHGVAVDIHGNIVVTGGLAAEDTKSGWTRKWSPDGAEELWTSALTGSSGVPTVGRSVAIAADQGVVAAGSEGDEVWVVRYTG